MTRVWTWTSVRCWELGTGSILDIATWGLDKASWGKGLGQAEVFAVPPVLAAWRSLNQVGSGCDLADHSGWLGPLTLMVHFLEDVVSWKELWEGLSSVMPVEARFALRFGLFVPTSDDVSVILLWFEVVR